MKPQSYIIDAKGKVLGRLASEIAILLQGKHKADFSPSKDMGDLVIVKNVKEIKLSAKKIKEKKYYRHSGYLGGLKEIPLGKIFQKRPAEVLRRAVFGMLPPNKLRKKIIKRLKIE